MSQKQNDREYSLLKIADTVVLKLTVDQLFTLRRQIEEELEELGYYDFQ